MVWHLADLPNKKNNGFERDISGLNAIVQFHIRLPSDSRGIIGVNNDNILVSTKQANKYYIIDKHGSFRHNSIPLKSSIVASLGQNFEIFADNSKNLVILSKRLPYLIKYDTVEKKYNEIKFTSPNYFYAIRLSAYKFAFQSLRFKEKSFGIYSLMRDQLNVDSIFSTIYLKSDISTDGQLLYESASNKIVYMHYYKNYILVLDSMLNPVNKIHTIDTVTNSLIYSSKGPIISSNQRGAVYNDVVYIASNLKADNEKRKFYMQHIPVDRYQLSTGIYLGSFYLPLRGNSLIRSIVVTEHNRMIVLNHNMELTLFYFNRI